MINSEKNSIPPKIVESIPEFPKLMKLKSMYGECGKETELIVLFSNLNNGMVVYSKKCTWKVGHFSGLWSLDNHFEDCDDVISLSNQKSP